MQSQLLIQDEIKGKAFLAPMVATTDIPFRKICKDFGAFTTTTEMVSARGIVASTPQSYRNAVIDPDERPIVVQLFDSKPEYLERAIQRLLPFHPAAFDLNAGCPADGVCQMGAGAQLLDNLPQLAALLRTAVRVSPLPVSVKVRTQGANRNTNIETIARLAEDCGVAYITVHARSRFTHYECDANWDDIARAKRTVGIPVVGNGDIFSAADAFAMMERTGCDAVMIARGSLGTPWIFRDFQLGRRCAIHEYAPAGEEFHVLVKTHLRSMIRELGPFVAAPRIRKHAFWYLRHYVDFPILRKWMFETEDADSLVESAMRFMETQPCRYEPDSFEYVEIEQLFRKRVLFWMQAVEAV